MASHTPTFTENSFEKLHSNKGLYLLFSKFPLNFNRAMRLLTYEKKLKLLQVELIKLQASIIEKNERVIVIFEGRDAAGKGGAIRRIIQRINPRHLRVVALRKPSKEEQTQWYFQRYIKEFPNEGEIVFFNRSWYNRAVLEPVNRFCTKKEYETFMSQVNDFERMITESGIRLIKIYLSISKKEQIKRFDALKKDPLKQWKITKLDKKVQQLWFDYTVYKNKMFDQTNTEIAPWKVIDANRKATARINVIKHLLSEIPYDKDKEV